MRIEITPSARQHGIADDEIRAVVEYPALRVVLTARRVGTRPVLHIGPAVERGPFIEVIVDIVDPVIAVAFHAMMLRKSLVTNLGIEHLVVPSYGTQRS
ncbi:MULTISPECIES: hypothetical protein [Gordonia]|uniref:Uncharacterized protein n=2 Tax=Gordonia TaxID=2053 RepID=A0A9X3D9M5_9ACTN|nr:MULTISPECIES: hypothetical protein [Gordonia]MCF3937071.1 hypothetical protein [Gordonia tangerina]MCX2966574.1 hypothetical protein [Gordonia aquimaris]